MVRRLGLFSVLLSMAVAAQAVSDPLHHKKDHLQIVCERGLRFGGYVAGGSLQVNVAPDEAGAAVCVVRGCANARFKIRLLGEQVVLHRQGRRKPIRVRDFRFGGALDRLGIGRLGPRGVLANCRIGASAYISIKNRPGLYRGEGTVRIIYL